MLLRIDCTLVRHLAIGLAFSAGLVGCDGVSPFQRDRPRDPKSDRYVPQTPSPLEARVVAPEVVQLSWPDLNRGETGFVLRRSRGSAYFTDVFRVAPNDTTVYDTLDAWGRYTYTVTAVADSVSSDTAQSPPVSVTGWVEGPSLPEKQPRSKDDHFRETAEMTALPGGQVLVVSPSISKMYVPSMNNWTDISHPDPSENVEPQEPQHIELIALSSGGALYSARVGRGQLIHRVFEPGDGSWSQVSPISRETKYYASVHTVQLSDGRVLVVGDSGGGAYAGLWTPSSNSFRTAPAPPEGIESIRAPSPLRDNRVLLTSSRSSFVCGALFDGDTETWTPLEDCPAFEPPEPPQARLGDGRIIALGFSGSSHLFSPESEFWNAVPYSEDRNFDPKIAALATLPSGTGITILRDFSSGYYHPARFRPSSDRWEIGPRFPETGSGLDTTPGTPPDRIVAMPTSQYDAFGIDWDTRSTFFYRSPRTE